MPRPLSELIPLIKVEFAADGLDHRERAGALLLESRGHFRLWKDWEAWVRESFRHPHHPNWFPILSVYAARKYMNWARLSTGDHEFVPGFRYAARDPDQRMRARLLGRLALSKPGRDAGSQRSAVERIIRKPGTNS